MQTNSTADPESKTKTKVNNNVVSQFCGKIGTQQETETATTETPIRRITEISPKRSSPTVESKPIRKNFRQANNRTYTTNEMFNP